MKIIFILSLLFLLVGCQKFFPNDYAADTYYGPTVRQSAGQFWHDSAVLWASGQVPIYSLYAWTADFVAFTFYYDSTITDSAQFVDSVLLPCAYSWFKFAGWQCYNCTFFVGSHEYFRRTTHPYRGFRFQNGSEWYTMVNY